MASLRLEDGQRGRIFAGLALGLRSVARPQADGLNAQKGIIGARDGAVGLLAIAEELRSTAATEKEKTAS